MPFFPASSGGSGGGSSSGTRKRPLWTRSGNQEITLAGRYTDGKFHITFTDGTTEEITGPLTCDLSDDSVAGTPDVTGAGGWESGESVVAEKGAYIYVAYGSSGAALIATTEKTPATVEASLPSGYTKVGAAEGDNRGHVYLNTSKHITPFKHSGEGEFLFVRTSSSSGDMKVQVGTSPTTATALDCREFVPYSATAVKFMVRGVITSGAGAQAHFLETYAVVTTTGFEQWSAGLDHDGSRGSQSFTSSWFPRKDSSDLNTFAYHGCQAANCYTQYSVRGWRQ